MSATVADHLLERLAANGAHRVYGYPGDGINAIMGAMDRAGGGIDGPGPLEFVQVRHEEMAGDRAPYFREKVQEFLPHRGPA